MATSGRNNVESDKSNYLSGTKLRRLRRRGSTVNEILMKAELKPNSLNHSLVLWVLKRVAFFLNMQKGDELANILSLCTDYSHTKSAVIKDIIYETTNS